MSPMARKFSVLSTKRLKLRAPTMKDVSGFQALLACPRYSTRYVAFEQASALAAQPRSS